jgi:hypothetical protein
MNPSAIVVTRGRVHDGSPITIVFVSVTALVPPAQWDHSVDANISLGPLVPHPRPFRWWISFFLSLFWYVSPRIVVLWQSIWETVFIGQRFPSFESSLYFSFHFGLDIPFDC